MKSLYTFAFLLIFAVTASAQTKPKVKGSKIVKIEKKEVEAFNKIEIADDIEVSLISAATPGIELEADDNLQDALDLKLNGGTIVISTNKIPTGYKAFKIRIMYDPSLELVVARSTAVVNVLETIKVGSIRFEINDKAKLFLNSEAEKISVQLDNDAMAELNIKATECSLTALKTTSVKALINTATLQTDLYQKAIAKLEGDAELAKYRLDNNSALTANNLTAQAVEIATEAFSEASIHAAKTCEIKASGKSEIKLYGTPKVDLALFADSASLFKKAEK
ncbi:GIN domain-containing protein [Flavobacterium aurantiibacter]|uniref:Putative auto-transporter adhesin head GIN domain-containing protein n=1 Tax=Flavobacterium aurantiibacter TaxID=2023067 RepID=A0A256A8C8_9FLAO|nr:DUF2807 domain-containing protein [Flavobacterium aurantiibacter]OYQ49911.1 hypothetical protein CHX27_01160 [Flavobacterium aurantiibacter]